jgi:N-acetylated-alpha-linked acidic dipeptidase
MKLVAGGVLAIAATIVLASAWLRTPAAPLGFSHHRAARQDRLERRLLAIPTAASIRDAHRFLTAEPHVAGSKRDRELADWTSERFRACGLENVGITTHDVLLPSPLEVGVEMTAPNRWRASMREEPVAGDADTARAIDALEPAHHAYSASGEVTAPVVYAGAGAPEDYAWLAARRIDVRGKIVLVRHSVPYSYRGFKALTAERRGAAAILMYSDPADDGAGRGEVYPRGPWGPDSRIQRGGIAYDFIVPGDPLTPGWASVPGAPRIEAAQAATLPTIVSVPLSSKDARVILEAMGGPEVPIAWRGGLPIPYRAGSDSVVLRVRVRSDDRVRPVWTVTGTIRGGDLPEQTVIAGNHRDAWLYGGVDPSSGSAALIELACSLGALTKTGWRPRRSIMFASWDAEEFALTSSTEWAEQHESWLRRNAVAYLNVDSAVAGPELNLAAVPALNPMLEEIARAIRDPGSGLTLAARTTDRRGGRGLVNNRLGGGSDHTVFLNHLGVPIADLSFDGPYGVYHSIFDTHAWVSTIGDPGFSYHLALVKIWGLAAVRLADADVLPLDYVPYAERVAEFAAEVGRVWGGLPGTRGPDPLRDVKDATAEMRFAAADFNERRRRALDGSAPSSVELRQLDDALLAAERALLDADGLPGRSWFRHTIFAPRFTYEPEVLPGVAEALADFDEERARAQARRLSQALRRAAAALASDGN